MQLCSPAAVAAETTPSCARSLSLSGSAPAPPLTTPLTIGAVAAYVGCAFSRACEWTPRRAATSTHASSRRTGSSGPAGPTFGVAHRMDTPPRAAIGGLEVAPRVVVTRVSTTRATRWVSDGFRFHAARRERVVFLDRRIPRRVARRRARRHRLLRLPWVRPFLPVRSDGPRRPRMGAARWEAGRTPRHRARLAHRFSSQKRRTKLEVRMSVDLFDEDAIRRLAKDDLVIFDVLRRRCGNAHALRWLGARLARFMRSTPIVGLA
jgi:hypothetical protein